jgi:hypothetical protein
MSDPNEKTENPNPFFHNTENFSSVYFGKIPDEILNDGKPVDKQLMATIIALLTDSRNSELKEETLAILRNRDARSLLVMMLQLDEYSKYRQVLLATCWESGLDFSAWLNTFVEFLFDENPQHVLEAITVIEEMSGPFEPEMLENAKSRIANFRQDHAMHGLISAIHRKLVDQA